MKLRTLCERIVDHVLSGEHDGGNYDALYVHRNELVACTIRDVQEDQAPRIAYGLLGPATAEELAR